MCDILRDDGITYQQYVNELTYILFLKMCKEREVPIPEKYRWDNLVNKQGEELKSFYKELLTYLGTECPPPLCEIYRDAKTNIDEPKNLEKIINNIDKFDWYSVKEEGLGSLYEGLLEKNATEKKSGAGQYFTPRVLINVMTKLIDPKAGEYCNDPACGTFGFMIAADRHVKENTDDLNVLSPRLREFQRTEAFSGCELVHDTYRLALMNAMLHDVEGKIYLGDTLSDFGKRFRDYDVVLTNPPFGTKKGGERATRQDFTYTTNNKQLNFLQHIYKSLNTSGTARAAVIVPDNVLFTDGDGERIRRELMEKCSLHTILRLPAGIFYAPSVKTNVIFFTRGREDTGNTKEVWVYDLRTQMPSFGKTNPLTQQHFEEFIDCYKRGDLSARRETYSPDNPNGRWRRYSYKEILSGSKTSLDLLWMEDSESTEDITLSELFSRIKEKSENISQAVYDLEKLIEEVEE